MIEQDLEQLLRSRAHELWEQEGRPEGRARIHWLHAEAEFRERFCASAPAQELHSLAKSPAENLVETRAEEARLRSDPGATKTQSDE